MMDRFLLRAQQNAVLPRGVVLHASAVANEEGAFVFLAPSGGGKSTLMSLLSRKHFGAIGDDSVILARGTDDVIRCLPCGSMKQSAGTENIHAAPLKAFFFLERGSPVLKQPLTHKYALYRSIRHSSIMAYGHLSPVQQKQARQFLEMLFRSFPPELLRYDCSLHSADVIAQVTAATNG